MRLFKRVAERAVGYWIHKVSTLPVGADLRIDLNHLGITPRVIFDVGANVGQTYQRFREYFPAARIVSFEPVAKTFSRLKNTIGTDTLARAEHTALGEAIGQVTVTVSDEWSEGNSLFGSQMRDAREETISISTVDDYCTLHRIERVDLLKIDTEGYELPVLRGSMKTELRAVFAEVSFKRGTHTFLPDIMSLLGERGMYLYGLYDIAHSPDGSYASHGNALFIHQAPRL